jgi:hypothetical protein
MKSISVFIRKVVFKKNLHSFLLNLKGNNYLRDFFCPQTLSLGLEMIFEANLD